ncbi:hypothetical protein K449DRAFT_398020 [Hypoxylon sp. EC38]|nr:hypothetical protein K449DRAFT_398020 [Hypoxylon sp. EC38]
MTTAITTFLLTVNLSDGPITIYQDAGNSGYPGEHAEGMQSAGSCLLQLQLLAFSSAIMPSPIRRGHGAIRDRQIVTMDRTAPWHIGKTTRGSRLGNASGSSGYTGREQGDNKAESGKVCSVSRMLLHTGKHDGKMYGGGMDRRDGKHESSSRCLKSALTDRLHEAKREAAVEIPQSAPLLSNSQPIFPPTRPLLALSRPNPPDEGDRNMHSPTIVDAYICRDDAQHL